MTRKSEIATAVYTVAQRPYRAAAEDVDEPRDTLYGMTVIPYATTVVRRVRTKEAVASAAGSL